MSIHESIPQTNPEPEQLTRADVIEDIRDFNAGVAEGQIPTYEGLVENNILCSTFDELDVKITDPGVRAFTKNVEIERWALSSQRHAENFRITRARSLDELTPTQIKTAAILVKAKHAAPDTHLEAIQQQAKHRIELSEDIYKARNKEQPTTPWVERQLANEAQGITAQSREEQEHKNSREKTRKAFVARYAPRLISHMFSEKYEPGAEDGNFPIDSKEYEAIGIGDSEELISRAVAFEFNNIVAGFDSQEAVKPSKPDAETPVPAATTETASDTTKPARTDGKKPAKTGPAVTSADEFADYIGRLSGYKVGKLPGDEETVKSQEKPVVTNAAEFTDYIEKLSGMRFSPLDNEAQPDDAQSTSETAPDKKYQEYISRLAGFRVSAEDAPDEAKKEKREIGKRLLKAARFTGKVVVAATAVVMVQKYGINPLEHMVDHAGTVSDTVTPAMYGSELMNR